MCAGVSLYFAVNLRVKQSINHKVSWEYTPILMRCWLIDRHQGKDANAMFMMIILLSDL